MPIALQVMINQSDSFLGFEKNARKYINGDVVKVYSVAPWTTKVRNDYVPNDLPITSPRTGFIFIDNEPVALLKRYNQVLCAPREDIADSIDKVRDWGFDLTHLTTPNYQELIDNKYTTITWGQLKAFLKKKSEDRLLLDSDIT